MSPATFAEHCHGLKLGSSLWLGRCPCHPDDESSLFIGRGDANEIKLFCLAGCKEEKIVEASNVTLMSFFGHFEVDLEKLKNGISLLGKKPPQADKPKKPEQEQEDPKASM